MNSADGLGEIPPETLIEMQRRMWLIRKFEEAAARLVDSGELEGEVHLSIGQEGEIVGSCLALRPDDYMTGNHRSHGHPIGKGADPAGLMAELMGRATGVCKGKGGSMHLADFSVGSLGESGIVASAIPVAVGAAMSSQIQGNDRVVLSFFGDGAVNEGAFHESMNLASIWKLPVVFLCENNQYAMTVAAADVTAVKQDLAERAVAYDMPGIVVDGQDAVAVFLEVREAVERARSGGGPSFIEAKTYRFDEHAYRLPVGVTYRDPVEVQRWKQRDPIWIHHRRLVDADHATEVELSEIEAAADAAIGDAVSFAMESPEPDRAELFEDMYANPFPIRRS
jgi:pyruvate dehydrogenase E1 component alpha subunit